MKQRISLLFCLASFVFPGINAQENEKFIINDDLEIIPISKNAFIHISYLEVSGYGRFPCNGLIFVDDNSAVVIDTPVTDSISVHLLTWLKKRGFHAIAVIPTHWHVDNLGGLKAFHEAGIPSYSYSLTRELAAQHDYEIPQNAFSDSMILKVGRKEIICKFLGAGHSFDNIVVWIPSEKILFGGCLVRSAGSSDLGNIADADVEAWPDTILEVIKEFSDVEIIVPGHGKPGGKELLWHTYQLLRPK